MAREAAPTCQAARQAVIGVGDVASAARGRRLHRAAWPRQRRVELTRRRAVVGRTLRHDFEHVRIGADGVLLPAACGVALEAVLLCCLEFDAFHPYSRRWPHQAAASSRCKEPMAAAEAHQARLLGGASAIVFVSRAACNCPPARCVDASCSDSPPAQHVYLKFSHLVLTLTSISHLPVSTASH